MIGADKVHLSADGAGRRPAKSIQALSYKCIRAHCPPAAIFILEERPSCPLAASSLEEKNMLSISQNSICLPARAFKTINKIREHTMATVPLLPPSVSLSAPPLFFPSHFVLAHLPVQCRHSVVCLHLLSWGNFSTKPPHAGRQQWRTHTHTHRSRNQHTGA